MLRNNNEQAMIDRARKAGLSTRELYQALASQPLKGAEQATDQADSNGYVTTVSPQGRRVYRQADTPPS
jgi:hypothetical protein